ncbi:hypothetical protein HB662_13040 [Roseomonas frigidaquae]|uniref:LRAT domain-containing protein n=1 Tax=Falsiroseomonas frigidaquae TaxID=487318 RepID=A0ABX1F073_9PROT|nr:hypothetical protein [Falsiroseomonas frigidaquae]
MVWRIFVGSILPTLSGPLVSIVAGAFTAIQSFSSEPATNKSIHPGVVLRVSRRFYWHYGLYVGAGQIVHYTNDDVEMSGKNII